MSVFGDIAYDTWADTVYDSMQKNTLNLVKVQNLRHNVLLNSTAQTFNHTHPGEQRVSTLLPYNITFVSPVQCARPNFQ